MSVNKVIKTIAFTAVAQEHHNHIKIKNLMRWLKSGHEVRVQINGKADRQNAMENIFKQLEKEVKSGAEVKQKVIKPDYIKFYLRPTPEAANFVIEEPNLDNSDNLSDITANKDILSGDFEEELNKSIREEIMKKKKDR